MSEKFHKLYTILREKYESISHDKNLMVSFIQNEPKDSITRHHIEYILFYFTLSVYEKHEIKGKEQIKELFENTAKKILHSDDKETKELLAKEKLLPE